MDKKFIDTAPYQYTELCDRYKRFSMPHNQRPYAWKNTQLSEFWDAIIENDKRYFIGNLVCLNPSSDSDDTLVIVDGQQRLTTISLFLISFKIILTEIYKTKNNRKIEGVINLIEDYLYWRNPRTQELKPRLIPGKENLLEIYNALIDGDFSDVIPVKLDDNQIRYWNNIKSALILIRKEIKNKKEEDIDLLVQKILSVEFIAIVVNSENDIYDLFEGLNSTGLGLGVADLLKNAVLKSTNQKNIRYDIELNWAQIENIFESTRTALFPKFLRHYWISRNGYISGSKLFKTIKKDKIEGKPGKEVGLFTKELLDSAQIYIGLRFEEYESNLSLLKKDESLKKTIRMFEYMGGLDQVYEVLLAFYNKKLIDKNYKNGMLKSDMQRLLNFVILARFSSINPSDYENSFASMCEISIRHSDIEYKKHIGKEFKELFNLLSDRESFAVNFSQELEYGSDSKLIEYILLKIMSNYNEDDRGITVLDPNIEHILPKSPKKWGYSREQVSEFVNKIGNLTILHSADNNDVGNETLEEKIKSAYSVSKFNFNKDIKNYKNIFMKDPKNAVFLRGKDIGKLVYDFLKVI